ncbi:hypothetical protein PP47_gp13 [Pectobacterium phage PP47]|uniref:Uncharacterized protein n=2 Tax=Pektosvirus TaxID=2732689 RepID=A0A1L7DS09_9CAUD|nr:hypothetical protein HOR48_gp13 [Pectobacterium phage PP81]YP_009788710.1 hypothetical protein HOR52_gp13 [Pectobacterium phage PP47]APU03036.1 hypothetical protein PP81_gp13 [Pectobacterium phage PP81]APW79753.1 hypothetical protein PP47_gp13 [Pectobacterium phage PP47]
MMSRQLRKVAVRAIVETHLHGGTAKAADALGNVYQWSRERGVWEFWITEDATFKVEHLARGWTNIPRKVFHGTFYIKVAS